MTEARQRAPLAFVDTETTGLDPNRHEVWEVALVLRTPTRDGFPDHEVSKLWHLPVDLGAADPVALTIGRYYDRCNAEPAAAGEPRAAYDPRFEFAREFAELTHGAHLVAAVPSFDDAFLRRLLVKHGACPGWHYHLVDVEALAVGYLAAERARGVSVVIDEAGTIFEHEPPWNSRDLTAALGIEVDESTKHTAEGDVAWAMAIYDKVMGS